MAEHPIYKFTDALYDRLEHFLDRFGLGFCFVGLLYVLLRFVQSCEEMPK